MLVPFLLIIIVRFGQAKHLITVLLLQVKNQVVSPSVFNSVFLYGKFKYYDYCQD